MTNLDIIRQNLRKKPSSNIDKCKYMRQNMSEAQKSFWHQVNANKFMGLKFRRFHPIKGTTLICPFYCHELGLAIYLKPIISGEDQLARQKLEQRSLNIIMMSDIEYMQDPTKLFTKIRAIHERN